MIDEYIKETLQELKFHGYSEEQIAKLVTAIEQHDKLVEALIDITRQVNKITFHRHVMSYNDSYFGEPQGMLKITTRELESLIDKLPDEIKAKVAK